MASGIEPKHDVVVVGSGAGGGMAAYVLTKAGLKVLMLEAGGDYDPKNQTAMLQWNRQAPLGGTPTPDKKEGFYYASHGGWEIEGEPYTTAKGSNFEWYRSRMLGGRTNHWGRNSFRMGPYDFKAKSRDGLGADWPISYDDIAPYYDKTEALIGVYGVNSGLENHPDSAPGILHEPPAPRVHELFTKAAANDLGMPCIPARRAILTKPMDDRSACYYASSCGRGCNIGAAFQSTTSLLPWARATGNLEILTDAMAHELEIGEDGRATGVWYTDTTSGEQKYVKARAVVLAASTGETARILLNSQGRSPDGVANSSGQVGRNLQDTVGSTIIAQIPGLENRPRYNEDGAMGMHMYIPFWLYGEQARGELDFPRGYHFELVGGFFPPAVGLTGLAGLLDGYGPKMKEEARRYYGSFVALLQRGEMIPNDNCYAEIDSDVKDKYGIPVLKFHYAHSDHEYNQVTHAQQSAKAIIDRMGGTIFMGVGNPKWTIDKGGKVIHEVGTCRMGDDRGTSVVNQFGQAWDVDNLFMMDASIFSSKAHKNPTLTILALAWRNADYLVEQMTQGAF